MYDSRLDQLARVLVRHSTKLQKGESVLVELFDVPDEMGIALIRACPGGWTRAFEDLASQHCRIPPLFVAPQGRGKGKTRIASRMGACPLHPGPTIRMPQRVAVRGGQVVNES